MPGLLATTHPTIPDALTFVVAAIIILGGAIGVIVALWFFARSRKLNFVQLGDMVTTVVPIGLFFGRIANFVNGELWGKVTNVPWAMVFPNAGDLPRHPSQLYEAGMEGLLLFIILQVSVRVFRLHERPGLVSAIFFTGYGTFRFIAEIFREPDTMFIGWFSLGMAFSIPKPKSIVNFSPGSPLAALMPSVC